MRASEYYSEKIQFSKHGIRMAVMEPNGKISHLDNEDLEVFGGVLPCAGDYITTLWDPRKPEPAEAYLVLERHWIGELKGDNCWWLLLEVVQPTQAHRALYKVARKQSAETRKKIAAEGPKLTLGEKFRKMQEARASGAPAKTDRRKPRL